MQLNRDSKLLRIFIGELDKSHNVPLYEALVLAAKKEGIAGATVLRGILSFGASSRIHTAKLLDLSDRKSTRLNSSHANISYAVFCLKKKNNNSLKVVYAALI